MGNTIHQESPKVVVERLDCMPAVDYEHHPVPGILPVAVVYGQSSVEAVGASLGFVVDTAAVAAVAVLQPQIHRASAVVEVGDHVAVEGTNVLLAAYGSQL
jgi:hypothetical protein